MSYNENDEQVKVDNFMAMLNQQTAPMAKRESKVKKSPVEKISLNFEGNFGRYQILPISNVVTDYPYVTLFNTREINMPRKTTSADGQEGSYSAWIKILPKSAYIMKDSTGRIVSSLTSEEDKLLNEAYAIYDELYEELDVKNNSQQYREVLRKRNYTIFHGMCLNKWKFDGDGRTADRQNFSGLFVCTAKGLISAVQDNINEKSLMTGGDQTWINGIYNRKQNGRDGFIILSISRSKTSAGYTVTVNHEAGRANVLKDINISEEDLNMMSDPVATFLAWQANREDESVDPTQRRLFNASLIKETIDFMTSQLAAVRMAKQSGTDIMEAMATTNESLLNSGVVSKEQAEVLSEKNDAPFQSPAVSHVDPVTSAPVNTGFADSKPTQSAPFTPGFGFGSNDSAGNGDLPF